MSNYQYVLEYTELNGEAISDRFTSTSVVCRGDIIKVPDFVTDHESNYASERYCQVLCVIHSRDLPILRLSQMDSYEKTLENAGFDTHLVQNINEDT